MKNALTMAIAIALAGCSVPEDAGFGDVKKQSGHEVHWFRGGEEDAEVRRRIDALLGRELTPESAVQIVLLNNPGLQARYEDLGVSQAELVQAGILENPVLDGSIHFPAESGAKTGLEFEVLQEFVDLIMFPAKKRLASHEFERTKLEVADAVIETASEAVSAWYEVVAARQAADVRHAIAAAAEARAELAKRIKEAGNISELALAREQDEAEEAKREWDEAEAEVREAREKLTVLLGVWGPQTEWTVPAKLPDLPGAEVALERIESLAVARRLDLAAALRDRDASDARLDMVKSFRWFGMVEFGFGGHREPEPRAHWLYGPHFAITIPIFDRQQAQIFALEAELRRREAQHRDLALRIRSEARVARDRVVTLRRRVEHQLKVVIPLRQRIVELAMREYNFMLIGIREVLEARQEEYDAYAESIELLRDYWIARAELKRAVGGTLPQEK